ncbi:MAG: glycosyltransferase family 4 protein [Acidobacteriota bacterium]
MDSWRILFVNATLAGRTGTETALRDLVVGLKAAGQQPMVYSPELGEIAEEIRASGIPVFSQLAHLPEEPDIVHGNHHVETVEALLRFRNARGLFVCHDRRAHISAPPRMGRILRYVAVDYNCLERLTNEYGIPEHLTRVIYNSVDTARFLPRPPLPPHPQRALVFSNYAGPGTQLDTVQDACALLSLPVDVVGSLSGKSSSAPERLVGQYDLVFAKARCALEAMAVGAAVVLCDTPGLGPLVTSAEVAHLRPWNFGARLLRDPLDPAGIVRQVQRYDAADAAAVSQFIRERANLSRALERYLHLYAELMEEPLLTTRTADRELDQYLRHTVTRMGQMEIELAQYRQPDRMEALSDAVCAHLKLSIEKCPEFGVCGRMVDVRVELENGSSEKLGSFPPFPIQLSYRWFRDGIDEVTDREGLRTALRPPLSPGGRATYSLNIAAPDEPGRYRLRVTIVQEFLRWLDSLPCLLSAEATLVIVSSPAAPSPA